MGFHRRHLTKEILLHTYTSKGMDGVKQLLRGGDALMYDDLFCGVVVEMYHELGESFDMTRSWKEIEQTILDELPN